MVGFFVILGWVMSNREGALPPSIVNWLSGLAGGTAQVIAGHPFDTIKVHMDITVHILIY